MNTKRMKMTDLQHAQCMGAARAAAVKALAAEFRKLPLETLGGMVYDSDDETIVRAGLRSLMLFGGFAHVVGSDHVVVQSDYSQRVRVPPEAPVCPTDDEAILRAIGERQLSAREISARTHIALNRTRQRLYRLRRKGLVVLRGRTDRARWSRRGGK